MCGVLECTKEIITKNWIFFCMFHLCSQYTLQSKIAAGSLYLKRIQRTVSFKSPQGHSIFITTWWSSVYSTVVDSSLLNLFKVMLIERKIWYEDRTNNEYKHIRIYYESSKPPTCRPTCFGHSYGNPEGGVIKGCIITKTSKTNARI